MLNSGFGTFVKYAGTLLVGFAAGGYTAKTLIERAMRDSYQKMMGQMDPNLMSQLQGAFTQAPAAQGLQAPAQLPMASMPALPQAPVMAPPAPQMIQRAPIKPLNITAGQLGGGGGLKV